MLEKYKKNTTTETKLDLARFNILETSLNESNKENKILNEKIVNQVLLVETVIVGDVPETYYNLEGMTSEDVMEVMQ